MLLRRFTKHVTDQNWFAVGLDVLVVIVGIIVGLQVTEWNEARKEAEEGRYHLTSLLADIENDLHAYNELIEISSGRMERSTAAWRLLLKAEAGEDDLAEFQKKHFAAFYLWGPKKKPAALSRIIDGGKLDLVPSRDIQQIIIDFDNAYDEFIYQTEISYGYSKDLTLTLMTEIEYTGNGIVSSLDDLRASKSIKAALRGKAYMQRIQLDTLNQVQAANIALKEKLEAYLGTAS
jgi:hypothetical protein